MDKAIRNYLASIGAKGGKAGTGQAKARRHTSDAMKQYWADVRAGKRPPPRRGR